VLPRTCRSHVTLLAVVLTVGSACTPAPPPPNEADIQAVVEGFYGAMKKGDTAAAMSFIAPDALFIESGRLETREQYETSHLPNDIEFESQVTGVRSPLRVTFEGNTAWVIATTEYKGTFDGAPVSFVSAQLMVLARDSGEWRIRSIHWSSRRL
jgi:ketosteroid isomerase-like protein